MAAGTHTYTHIHIHIHTHMHTHVHTCIWLVVWAVFRRCADKNERLLAETAAHTLTSAVSSTNVVEGSKPAR